MRRGRHLLLSTHDAVSVVRVRDGVASPLLDGQRVVGEFEVAGDVVVFTGDQRVAMEQVEQMYIALKAMGRPVDMVVVREGHSLVYQGKPWSRVEHARITSEWFERHL